MSLWQQTNWLLIDSLKEQDRRTDDKRIFKNRTFNWQWKYGKIKKASVAVFGVGGVGSHCIEALARCGIGRLILIDNDDVSLTNINRQSIAYHSTIGRMKTDVMRENQRHRSEYQSGNIRDFCSAGQCKRTSGTDRNYSLYNRCDRYGQCENCPCGTCRERNIPIISGMGTGNKLHAEMFEITDLSKTSVCPLCKVMRKELRNRGITHLKVLYSKEKPISAEGVRQKKRRECEEPFREVFRLFRLLRACWSQEK